MLSNSELACRHFSLSYRAIILSYCYSVKQFNFLLHTQVLAQWCLQSTWIHSLALPCDEHPIEQNQSAEEPFTQDSVDETATDLFSFSTPITHLAKS